MKLYQAFEVLRGDVIAFVGAGGKTSTLVNLGYELKELGWRVLATSTQSIRPAELALMPCALPLPSSPLTVSNALNEYGFVFLYDHQDEEKVYGASASAIQALLDTVDSDVLLLDADYADGKLWKAPYSDEPRIPPEASLVIPTASLGILEQTLEEWQVYNPQAIVEKYGFTKGSKIHAPWIGQILRDEEFGLKNIPPRARVIAYLNQTPQQGYGRARARLIAKVALKSPRLHGVAIGSARSSDPVLEVQRPIGAVVLAGGQSSRMGEAKVLLPWGDNKTIIEHIVDQLIRARIEHICVVTGYYADEVKRVLKPYDLSLVHNRAHKSGEMLSSLQTGVSALPPQVSALLMVLGDQPSLQPKLLYRLLNAYAEGAGKLIVPSYKQRRGHPILIARHYWREILDLKPQQSLRDVLNAHASAIHYVEAENDSVLRDIDTPHDYREERQRAGLPEHRPNDSS